MQGRSYYTNFWNVASLKVAGDQGMRCKESLLFSTEPQENRFNFSKSIYIPKKKVVLCSPFSFENRGFLIIFKKSPLRSVSNFSLSPIKTYTLSSGISQIMLPKMLLDFLLNNSFFSFQWGHHFWLFFPLPVPKKCWHLKSPFEVKTNPLPV